MYDNGIFEVIFLTFTFCKHRPVRNIRQQTVLVFLDILRWLYIGCYFYQTTSRQVASRIKRCYENIWGTEFAEVLGPYISRSTKSAKLVAILLHLREGFLVRHAFER